MEPRSVQEVLFKKRLVQWVLSLASRTTCGQKYGRQQHI
jgi:hypothetical protein